MTVWVAIVGVAIIFARPALHGVVGDIVWPQLVLLRRFGRAGLFLSWLIYYGLVMVPLLALFVLFAAVGGKIARHSYDVPVVVGVWIMASATYAIIGRNPSRALDTDLFAAHRLLDDLRQADLDRLEVELEAQTVTREDYESVLEGRPSAAFVAHLIRILHQVAGSEYPQSHTKTMAIQLIDRRLQKARSLLERGSHVAV
jgi:hypothetical protein